MGTAFGIGMETPQRRIRIPAFYRRNTFRNGFVDCHRVAHLPALGHFPDRICRFVGKTYRISHIRHFGRHSVGRIRCLIIVPWIADKLGPRFVDYTSGYTVLASGIVLGIMILPILVSLLIEIFTIVPQDYREASASLGATKWQTCSKVILRKAMPGIVAAVVLSISKAFGETIAVLMVCGNYAAIPRSLFDPCYPLPALIANNYGEMLSLPLYESALMFAAFILFFIILVFNIISRWILRNIERSYKM